MGGIIDWNCKMSWDFAFCENDILRSSNEHTIYIFIPQKSEWIYKKCNIMLSASASAVSSLSTVLAWSFQKYKQNRSFLRLFWGAHIIITAVANFN